MYVSLQPVIFSEIPKIETRNNAIPFNLKLEGCVIISVKPPKITIQFNDDNVTQQGSRGDLKNSHGGHNEIFNSVIFITIVDIKTALGSGLLEESEMVAPKSQMKFNVKENISRGQN